MAKVWRQRLRVLAAIDAIFPYQFIVYMVIWLWGIYTTVKAPAPAWWVAQSINHDTYLVMTLAFIFAPPTTFLGYLIPDKQAGTWMNLAGDSSLAFATISYTATLYLASTASNLAFYMVASLAACICVRALRDVIALVVIAKQPDVEKQRLEQENKQLRIQKRIQEDDDAESGFEDYRRGRHHRPG